MSTPKLLVCCASEYPHAEDDVAGAEATPYGLQALWRQRSFSDQDAYRRHNQGSRPRRSSPSKQRLCVLILTIITAIGAVEPVAAESSAVQPKPDKLSVVKTNLPTIEVAHAVMVAGKLNFGTPIPSVAEALWQIERHSEADDGRGREFATLDAYGDPVLHKDLSAMT